MVQRRCLCAGAFALIFFFFNFFYFLVFNFDSRATTFCLRERNGVYKRNGKKQNEMQIFFLLYLIQLICVDAFLYTFLIQSLCNTHSNPIRVQSKKSVRCWYRSAESTMNSFMYMEYTPWRRTVHAYNVIQITHINVNVELNGNNGTIHSLLWRLNHQEISASSEFFCIQHSIYICMLDDAQK